jgi:alpha-glucosidase
MPYIYSGMEEASRTGVPFMRPMFMEFPSEPTLATNGEEYMFGSGLLVAPKVWPFLQPYDVTLPKGDWFNYWTGEKLAGGRKFQLDPPLDTLPVYVRAGTIIPQQPVVQNTDETPKGPFELRVYPGPDCAGNLYMDDGNSFAYKKGDFLRVKFTCELSAGSVKVHMPAPEGSYRPWFKDVKLTVYSADKVRDVTLGGKSIKTWKAETGSVVVDGVTWTSAAQDLEILYNSR